MSFEQLRFSVPEIVSLLGLAQCIYIMVYMAFHAGWDRRALLPFFYFFVIGSAFFFDFAARFVGPALPFYAVWQWGLWFMGPPLAVLVIMQIAQVSQLPPLRLWGILLLIPVSFLLSLFWASRDESCHLPDDCDVLEDWLVVSGVAVGSLCMALLLSKRRLLTELKKQKSARQRYWLVLVLVFANLFFLFFMLLGMTPFLAQTHGEMLRTVMGLAFVYLAGTSLFRIYPQALETRSGPAPKTLEQFSGEEQKIIQGVQTLLEREKIYHEASYTRTDMAQELNVSESLLSHVINRYFGKSLPQLLNERRIEDACHFLEETDTPIRYIAQECGFNSVDSFNRVFREHMDVSPGRYRNARKEKKTA